MRRRVLQNADHTLMATVFVSMLAPAEASGVFYDKPGLQAAVDDVTMVRNCRGRFRCGGGESFLCGYPPGRSSYKCSCSSGSLGNETVANAWVAGCHKKREKIIRESSYNTAAIRHSGNVWDGASPLSPPTCDSEFRGKCTHHPLSVGLRSLWMIVAHVQDRPNAMLLLQSVSSIRCFHPGERVVVVDKDSSPELVKEVLATENYGGGLLRIVRQVPSSAWLAGMMIADEVWGSLDDPKPGRVVFLQHSTSLCRSLPFHDKRKGGALGRARRRSAPGARDRRWRPWSRRPRGGWLRWAIRVCCRRPRQRGA